MTLVKEIKISIFALVF